MFTASQYEFRSSADVRRNFPFPTLRTEEAPTRWLLGERVTPPCPDSPPPPRSDFPVRLPEADFVGSALLRESVNSSVGDDDKIYFFFTERSQEQMAYPSRTKVSRVARVCKVGTPTLTRLSQNMLANKVIGHIRDTVFIIVVILGALKRHTFLI